MTIPGTHVTVHTSLREILRGIELEDDDPLPPCGVEPADRPPIQRTTPGTALVGRDEVFPESGIGGAVERALRAALGEGHAHRTRIQRAGVGIAATAILSTLLLCGSQFILPTSLEPDAAESRLSDVSHASSSQWAFASAAFAAATESETQEDSDLGMGVPAFAALGQKVLRDEEGDISRPPTVVTLAARETVAARPGETVDLPFEVKGADALAAGTTLVIQGVPENAALSAAEPQGDGVWTVPIEQAADVKLTAYALSTGTSENLVAELRSPEGEVLARTTTRLLASGPQVPGAAVAESRPGDKPVSGSEARPASATVSEWATVAVVPKSSKAAAEQRTETVARSDESPREAPEWLTDGSRSALGGPR
jgi:hypothetical protein